jgi:hypothetical protein
VQIQWLTWKDSDTGLLRDGAWACGISAHDYPTMHHSLLHPCAGDGQACCGNHQNAPFLLRYKSFFHSKSALLVLAYEVFGSFPSTRSIAERYVDSVRGAAGVGEDGSFMLTSVGRTHVDSFEEGEEQGVRIYVIRVQTLVLANHGL